MHSGGEVIEKEKSKNSFAVKHTSQSKTASSPPVVNGSTISFHHVNYTVQVTPPGRKCGSVPKEILHDINGVFKPGMNGILGPTGGGKSSFLDVLAGRKNPAGLEGTLLVDGHKQPKNFKCMTGYVVQDDVVMGTLTVRENFMFSANLRLPTTVTKAEKEIRVRETIEELGLVNCADSKVGTEFIRGISGGERKRTNIGMELIISPSVLFLDEPTTGLDASTANAVMGLLHRLSRRGRTIIFSIHQPRYSIFKFFDRLMLLGAGRTIYHGPAAEALEYFQSIGYECEMHNNPPDFFLDVINGDSSAVQSMEVIQPLSDHSAAADGNGDIEQQPDPPSSSEETIPLAHTLSEKYTISPWYQSVREEIEPIEANFLEMKRNGTPPDMIKGEYATSFATQLRYLSKRALLNLIRNPQTTFSQFIVTSLFAVIVGLIFLQLGDDIETGLQNRIGALFFIIMNQVFGNLSAIELFIKERAIFIHENASGFYRVSAYFFSKVCCDLVPMRLIPLTVFCIIAYFMVGFQMSAAKFFIFYFTLFLTTMAASALGFFVSATVGVFAIANLLIAFCYVISMVFGGFLANLASMGKWLSWIQYLSLIRYSLNAQLINQLVDIELYQTKQFNNRTNTYDTIPKTLVPNAGTTYLTQLGIDYETAWDLWHNMLALGIIVIGLMFLAYVQLRRIPKLK